MIADKRRLNDDGVLKVAVEEPKKYKIRPRHEWVLIRKMNKQELTTAAGVVLPGADFFLGGTANSQRGMVVAAGAKSDLKEGDLVIFTNYAMKFADLEELTGDPLLELVRDEEVYCAVE